MTTTQRKYLENLNFKLQKLSNELNKPFKEIDNFEEIVKQINDLETEKKNINKRAAVLKMNAGQRSQAKILMQLLKIQYPADDIRTNDGYLHATKIKKYSALAAFAAVYPYVKFEYEAGKYTAAKVQGQRYTILKPEYNGNERDFISFETFEAAAKWQGIRTKNMSIEQFLSLEKRIIKESKKIEDAIKKSHEKIKKLESYFLESEGLLKRYDLHAYEYRSNF